ncbi:hypothetical protein [Polyangium sorediatum]|uniref:Uncharacterized protein n=1 Tax=Polyangium sorediatum TaxID=889274 RepID=A0ABT6PAP6_9BACT|nr:hypothetical protein [Polyangium sorediatum]MDI1437689.1 hypothetical protein [Polyangium sorediatum]
MSDFGGKIAGCAGAAGELEAGWIQCTSPAASTANTNRNADPAGPRLTYETA